MRRILTVALVAATVGVALAGPSQAEPLRQAPTSQLRPLVLTTGQAIAATGFAGPLTAGSPTAFRCGRNPDNQATYCSRIWDSTSSAAHPSISTVASFASPAAARAQISGEAKRAGQVGTVEKQSATYLLYYVTGLPDIGTAAVAQQAVGATYTYAWCTSAASTPAEPAVQCARDLLAAQTAKARAR